MSPDPYLGPPLKVGPYWVEDRIGRGGMGEVYRGFDERLERPVALKHVRSDHGAGSTALERFRREAKAIARLNHPAIVQIHDWVESDDGWWYVMELIEGRTLKNVIGGRPMSPGKVIAVGCAVAEGLSIAHDAGIVHRDLKPDNVMIAESGRVKLLDFGLAKSFGQEQQELSLTRENKIIGTVTAMSPEQASGDPVDERSDLFSLGSLLYEAATGESPFLRETAMQTLTQICTRVQMPAVMLNPDVPPSLSSLIDHLLEKQPDGRPENARAVLTRLREIGSRATVDEVDLAETVTHVATRQRPATAERATPSGAVPATTFSGTGASQPAPAASRSGIQSSVRRTSERRQVTVLSVGVVTDEGEPLDSEALFQVLPELESVARDLATRWQCHLEEVVGHRLVMCFGYPTSHEDETRRAVLAAIELVERMALLGNDLGQPLLARAGLQTGLAVAAVQGGEDRLILGRILDLANGLQDTAEPGAVLLGAETHGLVTRFFDCREQDPVRLAGMNDAQTVYRFVSARAESAIHDLDLVARREELDLLLGRWRLGQTGEGQAVWLTGVAGIGKSRLVRELERKLEAEGVICRKVLGSSDARSSPLYPVLQPLREMLKLEAPDATPEVSLGRMEKFLRRLELELDEHVPFLANLLNLPLGDRYRIPDLGPRRLQERFLEVLLSVTLAGAQDQRLLLVVEDLQWLDPSTLELVRMQVENVATVPFLLVITSRPEFEAPWLQPAHLTRIVLGRLEDSDSEKLIEVTGGMPAAPEVRALIIDKTDGVPLFVEELTKALLEADQLVEREGRLELADAVDRLVLPATLRDSLSARLDGVGAARWVAQIAAVLGRDFTFDQLAAVADLEARELRRQLDDLTHSELLLRRGYGSRRRYFFKHAMIREAAYDSLLAAERGRLHGRIADALEEMTELRDRHPERLAHHLTEADQPERAVALWLAAGELAISRSAHREGVDHLERGLTLVTDLPEGAERTGIELALTTKLAAAHGVLDGYSAPEVEHYWSRARELCSELEDGPRLFWVLWGLWAFHLVRSELDTALELGRRLLRIAEEAEDGDLSLVALGALGQAHYFRGELSPARRHLDRATELDRPDRDQPVASVSGQDVGVVALAARALVLWHLGEGDEAVRSSDAAVALARRVDHSYSLAFAHTFAARLHQSRGDLAGLEEHANEVVALSRERGYFWVVQGSFFLGCRASEAALPSRRSVGVPGNPVGEAVERDLLEQARRLMASGFDGYRSAGARLSRTYMLAQRAETSLRAGEPEDGGRLLEAAFAFMEESSERYWEADLLRLRGEVLVAKGHPEVAEEPLRQALALARERGDRALGLRAALALARWFAAAGRDDDARETVGEAVAGFADGSGEADVETAKAFLADLDGR